MQHCVDAHRGITNASRTEGDQVPAMGTYFFSELNFA